MTTDANQIWSLLTDSQLVSAATAQSLFAEFGSSDHPRTAAAITKWLLEKKAISRYQAKILLAGHSGPFRYGNYVVFERVKQGPLAGNFLARHKSSSFPVALEFVPGTQPRDLKRWTIAAEACSIGQAIEHPNLCEVYEAVSLPQHRFVASQYPQGSTLTEKLPPKARLAWQKACAVAAQIAQALEALHTHGLAHGTVSTDSIWLQKSGLAVLRWSPLHSRPLEPAKILEEFPLVVEPTTAVEHQPTSNLATESLDDSQLDFDFVAPELALVQADQRGDTADIGRLASPTVSSDLYALGCVLYRLLAGRAPFAGDDRTAKLAAHRSQTPRPLTKLELPTELQSLLDQLLAKQPGARPASAKDVASLLGLLSGRAEELAALRFKSSPQRDAYRAALRELLPAVAQPPEEVTAPIEILTDQQAGTSDASPREQGLGHTGIPINTADAATPNSGSSETANRIAVARKAAIERKRGRWKIHAGIAGAVLALATAVAVSAYFASQTEIEVPAVVKQTEPIEAPPAEPAELTPAEKIAALPPNLRPTILQTVVTQDDGSLWESPTTGSPLEFSSLPAAPKLIFHFRLAELLAAPEGKRIIRSLGPILTKRIAEFETTAGVELPDIEHLTMSLHTNADFEYDAYFVVQTVDQVARDQLLLAWGSPTAETLTNDRVVYQTEGGNVAYSFEPMGTGANAIQKGVRFALGRPPAVRSVALGESGILLGTMSMMAEWTDRQRHANLLFLRPALFNDEGQKLMGPALRGFNRQLALTLSDQIRGGLLSFHLDEGSYFEVMFDKSVDIKADDLRLELEDAFRIRRDELIRWIATVPSSPYWDQVRFRFGSMLTDLFRNLRWDVEHGEVIANAWLPPMAAHNLLAAAELSATFSGGAIQATEGTNRPAAPQSLVALLATKRDLNVANPPDLNVLMSDLESEIKEDFGKLPFDFSIRLLGTDLEKEGITKNQRPSELAMTQITLAEILTSIMIAANPAKDITGPSDPNCKLIWVVAEDPQSPGQQAILITTRAAATEKGYTLPEAFQE